MLRTRTLLPVALAALAAIAVAVPGPAQAGDASPSNGRYARAQAAVDYTVYAPGTTFGLARTSFQRFACGPDRDDAISAAYGSQETRTSTWIALNEASGSVGCTDGPDGVGPAATFDVNGSEARVFGNCPGGTSSCVSSTPALVRQGAYTVVTLPGSAARPIGTFVEVYSQALSLAQIKQFVRSLYPAT